MSDDQLANEFRALFDSLHTRVSTLTNDRLRRRATRLLKVMHGAADALKELAVDENIIQPFSGGDPKP